MPTYNEAENIGRQILDLESVRANIEESHSFDLLIVDDKSPDGTAEIAKSMGKPWVFIESLGGKLGLGNAYKHGFRWALKHGYTFVIEMDADGSHQSRDLHKLLEAPTDVDLVIGSRWIPQGEVENWPLHRRLLSQFGNVYASIALGFKIKDSTSGYRRISLKSLEDIDIDSISAKGYGFQIEVAYQLSRAGSKVKEVPITFIERAEGKSKMSLAIVIEALILIAELGIRRFF